MSAYDRFGRLPTAGKLLLILTAVLLPIGVALALLGELGMRSANKALAGQAEDRARIAARSVESLIARNILALRIAANSALASGPAGACDRMRRSLAIAPGVTQQFEIEATDGTPLCEVGEIGEVDGLESLAPGAIEVRIMRSVDSLAIRTGVIGGMATAAIPLSEIQSAAIHSEASPSFFRIEDGTRSLNVIEARAPASKLTTSERPIGGGRVIARIGISVSQI